MTPQERDDLRAKWALIWPAMKGAAVALLINACVVLVYRYGWAEPACVAHAQAQGWTYIALYDHRPHKVRKRPWSGWCEYHVGFERPAAQVKQAVWAEPLVKRVALWDLIGAGASLNVLCRPYGFWVAALFGVMFALRPRRA